MCIGEKSGESRPAWLFSLTEDSGKTKTPGAAVCISYLCICAGSGGRMLGGRGRRLHSRCRWSRQLLLPGRRAMLLLLYTGVRLQHGRPRRRRAGGRVWAPLLAAVLGSQQVLQAPHAVTRNASLEGVLPRSLPLRQASIHSRAAMAVRRRALSRAPVTKGKCWAASPNRAKEALPAACTADSIVLPIHCLDWLNGGTGVGVYFACV